MTQWEMMKPQIWPVHPLFDRTRVMLPCPFAVAWIWIEAAVATDAPPLPFRERQEKLLAEAQSLCSLPGREDWRGDSPLRENPMLAPSSG